MSILIALFLSVAHADSWPANRTVTAASCEHYLNTEYAGALKAVAEKLGYTLDELCALQRLADIFIDKRNFLNQRQEIIPHYWVTLHYNEYSCQYFVRASDLTITRKNCYNTF